MSNLTEQPTPPAASECCEIGSCNPCVWGTYTAEMQKWRIQQSELKTDKEKSNKSEP